MSGLQNKLINLLLRYEMKLGLEQPRDGKGKKKRATRDCTAFSV